MGKIKYIYCDVPHPSHGGMFRREKELEWLRRQKEREELARKQQDKNTDKSA